MACYSVEPRTRKNTSKDMDFCHLRQIHTKNTGIHVEKLFHKRSS